MYIDRNAEDRGMPQEKIFDTSKGGKVTSTFGRNVRLKIGKDGKEYVKLDSHLGKAVREALVSAGLKKTEDVRYFSTISKYFTLRSFSAI